MSPFQIDFGNTESKIVGIDLGTTNSLVAVIAGAEDREMLLTHPERTIYSVKRLMGRGPADIEQELKLFPFRIAPSSDSILRLQLGDRVMTPPEVSAHVLRKLKLDAEAALGVPIT